MSAAPPLPPNEERRLAALHDFHILDTPPDPRFDRLARLAARLFEVPVALVSLMDAQRQWFKACIGLSVPETPREVAFCAHTILGSAPMDVPDAARDPRFADNPLVTGPPGIRAYFGVPLAVGGVTIGTLCLIDTKPRAPLAEPQRQLAHELAALVTDLLKAHRAQWFARHNEQLFRTALASINEGFCIYDAEDHLQFFNPQYRAFHPASAELIVPGVAFETVMRAAVERGDYAQPQDDGASPEGGATPPATAPSSAEAPTGPPTGGDGLLARRLAAHRGQGEPIEQRLGDGRWLRIADYASAGGGSVSILSDITELKLYQRALEDAVRAAEDASSAKSRFLAMMSHEIRTPLNGVLGTLGLLADTPLAGEQRALVTTARRSGEALLTLLNDILDFSKIQAGKLSLEPGPFSLARTVDEILALFEQQATAKGLRLAAILAEDVPAMVQGDAGRVRQVVMNFLSNAIKFTEAGTVTVAVGRIPLSDQIEIAVTDTGPGIAAADLPRLFREFAQLDASTRTRRFEGTGLGLIISRELAELMGGTVGVTSQPGAGSRFWVRVPLPAAAPTAPAPAEDWFTGALTLRNGAGGHPRVLLAEDNLANQMVLRSMLERLGCRVEVVGNGAEAVAALADRPFDVVLMDIAMPVMDGIAATRALRALDQSPAATTPVIAVTANAFPEDLATYRRAGVQAHVSKPVVRNALLQALRTVGLRVEPCQNTEMANAATVPAKDPDGGPPGAGRAPASDPPLLDEAVLRETLADLSLNEQVHFLTVFTADLEAQLGNLTAPRPDSLEELEAVRTIAHTLKSSCGSFGALALADCFRGLDHACRTGDVASVPARITLAQTLGRRTLTAVQRFRLNLAPNAPESR